MRGHGLHHVGDRRAILIGLVGLALVGGFGIVLLVTVGAPTTVDVGWAAVVAARSPAADALAAAVNIAGGPLGSTITTVAVSILLVIARRPAAATLVALSVGLAAATESLLKVLVHRPRPDAATIAVSTFSYPSGHLTAAAALGAALVLAIWRIWIRILAGAWVLLMTWDRTYLAVHWITDCMAGAILGVSVALLVTAAIRRTVTALDRRVARRDARPEGPPRRPMLAALLVLIIASTSACAGPPDRSAAIPGAPVVPVGWNSWNGYGCDVDQGKVEAAAVAMSESGMRASGYRYVVLDDCWVAPTRDARGQLRADSARFPDGIAALARFVHARGLRFGLYTSATNRTCAQRYGTWPGSTGSQGHEAQDAATFAAWGVDFVKDDWCGAAVSPDRQRARFTAFRDGIRATGRAMALSINPNSGVAGEPGATEDWSGVATTVRITHDVIPQWRTDPTTTSSIGVGQEITAAERSVGSGWSSGIRQDADMLVVGLGTLTGGEQRSQLGMLAALGLPLMAGNDPTAMSASTRRLLTNAAIVDLATDRTGPPRRLADRDGLHIWLRPVPGGSVIAAYNPTSRTERANLRDVAGVAATELWSGRTVTTRVAVGAHATVLLRTAHRAMAGVG